MKVLANSLSCQDKNHHHNLDEQLRIICISVSYCVQNPVVGESEGGSPTMSIRLDRELQGFSLHFTIAFYCISITCRNLTGWIKRINNKNIMHTHDIVLLHGTGDDINRYKTYACNKMEFSIYTLLIVVTYVVHSPRHCVQFLHY